MNPVSMHFPPHSQPVAAPRWQRPTLHRPRPSAQERNLVTPSGEHSRHRTSLARRCGSAAGCLLRTRTQSCRGVLLLHAPPLPIGGPYHCTANTAAPLSLRDSASLEAASSGFSNQGLPCPAFGLPPTATPFISPLRLGSGSRLAPFGLRSSWPRYGEAVVSTGPASRRRRSRFCVRRWADDERLGRFGFRHRRGFVPPRRLLPRKPGLVLGRMKPP